MSARSRRHPWFGERKRWPGRRAQQQALDIKPLEPALPPAQVMQRLVLELEFYGARAAGAIDLDEEPHGFLYGEGR